MSRNPPSPPLFPTSPHTEGVQVHHTQALWDSAGVEMFRGGGSILGSCS